MGESGSGKSVTSLALMNADAGKAPGEIRVAGIDVVTASDQEIRVRGKHIAMVFKARCTPAPAVHHRGQIMRPTTHRPTASRAEARRRAIDVLTGSASRTGETHQLLSARIPAGCGASSLYGPGANRGAARRRAHHGPGRHRASADHLDLTSCTTCTCAHLVSHDLAVVAGSVDNVSSCTRRSSGTATCVRSELRATLHPAPLAAVPGSRSPGPSAVPNCVPNAKGKPPRPPRKRLRRASAAPMRSRC